VKKRLAILIYSLASGVKKLFKLPLLGWRYKKILQENKIDTSFSLMTRPNYINILSKLFGSGVKTIISERSQFSLQYSYHNLQSFINKKLVKLYNYADLIVTNSKGNAKDLLDNFSIKTKIKTIYNMIDIDKIDQFKSEEIALKKEHFTFVTIGRLDSGKNHKLLINAIQNIDAILWIIGDGELKKNLEFRIDNLKLQWDDRKTLISIWQKLIVLCLAQIMKVFQMFCLKLLLVSFL